MPHHSPHCLKNSETVMPAAFAFSTSLRYSALDILNSNLFPRRSAFGFGGRPMRFFILYPLSWFMYVRKVNLSDMAQLQSVVAGNAEAKYKLKAVNQNYGSNFQPVEMQGGAGQNRPPLTSFEH